MRSGSEARRWLHRSTSAGIRSTLKSECCTSPSRRTVPSYNAAFLHRSWHSEGSSEERWEGVPTVRERGEAGVAWRRLRERAGASELRFHDLRHEAVSRFFEKGLSVPEVALISGHRDAQMLFRYTHLKPEDVARKLG